MLSNKPLNQSRPIPEIDRQRIIELNQESFDQLLTFVDIVPDNAFDLGFIESNFAKDRDAIIQALISHPDCQEMQFEVWDFPEPDLRCLIDEILKVLPTVKVQPHKKLILIVRGLEHSIGITGEDPPILVDFNGVRDAYPIKVPHPMLFCLPHYAITRIANFAPDLWAKNSGTFVFKTPANTRDDAVSQTLDASKGITNCEVPEKQERIDLLKRFLMEYTPSHGRKQTEGNLKNRIRILNELGIAHRSRSEYPAAKYYLEQALDLAKDDEELRYLKANTLHELGISYANQGEVATAIALYEQSLEIKEKIGDVQGKAATLHQLAGIYAKQEEVATAIAFYQESLELQEKIGDVLGKAATLPQLAIIYANQGEVAKAIALYEKSLELQEQIGNVQGKAATLHQLAGIYANQGEVAKAIAFYEESLELKENIGNLQGKAATLHCLAIIYATQGEVAKAIAFYQQSLELKEQIGDSRGKAATFAMLGQLLADKKGDFGKALNYLQQSLDILQHLRSPDAETVRQLIAGVQQRAGN
ncbi:tetratricopeptide repeat protein [Microcoleus sp. OTE_8_concoct_300]|uniref:tetratricopeptide repeat protein n=1 Tax=Microcoleus sp. OTE_8_concoct_300 TaxID=2964710 RepID=UPI00403F92C0